MFDLKEFLHKNKLTQIKFAEKIGKSRSAVSMVLTGSMALPTEWEELIKLKFKLSDEEFSSYEMGSVDTILINKYTEKVEPVKLNFRLVPVINRYAYASYTDSWDDPEFIETLQTLPTTEMEDGNYLWFEVKGDSMSSETYPSIEEGDYILARELYKHHWGHLQLRRVKIWIIVHRERGILIKEIVKQSGSTITCLSWNPLVKEFDLDLSEINQLFYFKQLLRTKM